MRETSKGNMGHLISYSFHHIRIPASQITAALAAIHNLYQPETIQQLGTGLSYDSTIQETRKCYRGNHPPPGGFATLTDALREWSLIAVQQPDGSVKVVSYGADKAGDETVLFDAIAPFLDYSDSPRVDAVQSNHEYWRHIFLDGQHRQVLGKVVYADEYPELFAPSAIE